MEVVILDLETTGLSPAGGDRIVEVGAVRFRKGEPVSEFTSLVNPLRPISPGASRVNGLTDEMVSTAPVVDEVLGNFFEFLGNSAVAAHNAVFDISFLAAEACRLGIASPNNPVICTCELARAILPRLRSHSLANLVTALDLDVSVEHRALQDVYATWALWNELLHLAPRGSRSSIPDLLRLQGGAIPWPTVSTGTLVIDLPGVLARAMQNGTAVAVRYERADGLVTSRTIEPLVAYRSGAATYVVAYCRLRREERTFRLDRFLKITPED